MCKFIKKDGTQCGLKKDQEYCHIASHKAAVLAANVTVIEVEPELINISDKDVDTTIVYTPTMSPSIVEEVASNSVEAVLMGAEDHDIKMEPVEAKPDHTWTLTVKLNPYTPGDVILSIFDEITFNVRKSGIDCLQMESKQKNPKGYVCRIIFKYLEDGKASEYFRVAFKSFEDREQFEVCLNGSPDTEKLRDHLVNGHSLNPYIGEMKPEDIIDKKLYELVSLAKPSWIIENCWQLAGMLHKMPYTDAYLMMKTYIAIMMTAAGNSFDIPQCVNDFRSWETRDYPPSLNLTKIKQIVGGSNTEGYKAWKAKHELDAQSEKSEKSSKSNDEPKLTASQKLKVKLIDIAKDKYRRDFETGAVYERVLEYYYIRKYESPELFLNDIFGEDESFHMATKNDYEQLTHFIKKVAHPSFPFMAIDYNYIGFANGVYDLSRAEFIKADDVKPGVQVRKMINVDFVLEGAPLLDAYMNFQFKNPEEAEFVYFAIGRMMTRLDDNFQFMVMLIGQGGCGKSLLINLARYSYAHDQYGILSNSQQETFGLAEVATKQALFCDDMPRDIAKKLPKSDFLSMGSRGTVNCPIKGKQKSIAVHDWNIPTMINSNILPNYCDEENEVVRRIVVLPFENVVPTAERDVMLQSKIIANEYPEFLHRCRSAYIKYKELYGNVDVESFMPPLMLDQRAILSDALNDSYRFASSWLEPGTDKDSISRGEMNEHFKNFLIQQFGNTNPGRKKLSPQSVERAIKGCKFDRLNICKHCKEIHKKGCCDKYDRTARTKKEKYLNVRIKPDSE